MTVWYIGFQIDSNTLIHCRTLAGGEVCSHKTQNMDTENYTHPLQRPLQDSGRENSMGLQRVGQDWVTFTFFFPLSLQILMAIWESNKLKVYTQAVRPCDVCLCLFTQSCVALQPCGLHSPPGSSVHGILQARVLEWVAISSSRGSSRPRDWTLVSCIAGGFIH